MIKKTLNLTALLIIVCCGAPVMATEFHSIGYDAISMGGAGVASSRNSYSAYYNPALLPEHEHGVNISFSANYGYREVNLSKHIDRLADINIRTLIEDVAASYPSGSAPASVVQSVGIIKTELRALSDQNGLQMMPGIAIGVQVGNFGFGGYMVSEASASGIIDKNRLDLIYEEEITGNYIEFNEVTNTYSMTNAGEYQARSIEYAINNELTYVNIDGLAYVEIPIAYGHRFTTDLGNINIGGSFKIMPGYTFESKVDIDTDADDIIDNWEDYYKEDTSFGIDLGLLYKPSVLNNLSIGLVAKNINTPEFETNSGRVIKADPMVRAGVAYDFLSKSITLALDADLTRNDTFIDNYYSQYFGGGVSFHPLSWLSLRAGVMQNIQESDEGTILTGGFGIGAKWFQFDIAGQYGTKSETVDGNDIPKVAKVQLSLVSKW